MRLIACVFTTLFLFTAAHADVIVIANDSVMETTLSRKNVKEIFLGKKKYWKDKTKINVAVLSNGKTNSDFLSTYMDLNPNQYASHLKKHIFTTPGQAPRQLSSDREMVKYIKETKGSIGYIDSEVRVKQVNVLTVK